MVTADAPPRPRGSLTADEVIDAAIVLLSDGGAEGFTMRELGAVLGVNPMTIYLRFANKDMLLDAVAARLLGTLELPAPEGSLEDQVVACALAIRTHLATARSVLGLVDIGPHLAPAMVQATERGLALMTAAGLEGAAAVDAFRSVFWLAVGHSLADDALRARESTTMAATVSGTDPATIPTVVVHLDDFSPVDPDVVFDHTTRALFRGLRATQTHSSPTETP